MEKLFEKNSLFDRPVDKQYTVKLLKRNEIDKISILIDPMFKTMFQNEKRKKYPSKFISLLFGIDFDYLMDNLKLSKNEIGKKLESDKSERCDFVASINGIMMNIEVNNNSSIETMERNIEYAFRIYSEKIKIGAKYEYAPTIQINLNNFAFKGNDKIIDQYYIMNGDGEVLTKKLQIIQIYIPNIIKRWYTRGEQSLTGFERFILVMIEQDIEKARKLGGNDEFMNEYINEAIDVSRFAHLGEAYDKEWALKDEAFRDGISEGIEQQRNKEKIDMAKKMLSKGIDIKDISEITGLSMEEINKL